MANATYDPQLAPLIRRTATNLGINPSDLGTAMSFETGGTFNPSLWGGKGGNYLGLIQFGPEEQQKYGVKPDMPLDAHMSAVENFLRDRGVKPGMGMLDLYSTINAGSPGRYNASDTANGGTPGTVADKVASQMVGHRSRANTLLGDGGSAAAAPDNLTPPVQQAAVTAPQPNVQPSSTASLGSLDGGVAPPAAPAGGGFDADKALAAIGKMKPQQKTIEDVQAVPIATVQPSGLPAAGRLAQIMQSLRT